MSAKRLRRSLAAMVSRWERDANRLEEMAAGLTAEDEDGCQIFIDPINEVHRNLWTAIAQAEMALGATDAYLAERIAKARDQEG